MSELAKFMASKDLLSSPSSDMDEGEDEGSEDSEEGGDELSSCISDVADAIESGDKDGIMSALHDLVDCIKEDDKVADKEE